MSNISIVIPTYNYAAYLPRAIHSVMTQKAPEDELIIIDDGSTDETSVILSHLKNQYPSIQCYTQDNQGPGAARNQGIRLAKKEYIFFLDADDELLENALHIFRKAIENSPEGKVFYAGHCSRELGGKTRTHQMAVIKENNKLNFLAFLRKKIGISHGAILFHREVFERISYPEILRGAEDIPVFAHALALFKGERVSSPTVMVHKHEDSLRHQHHLDLSLEFSLVDLIFDETILPPFLMKYGKEYFSRRCLSLFRAYYVKREYKKARQYYHRAVRNHFKTLCAYSYLKKYIRSLCYFNR